MKSENNGKIAIAIVAMFVVALSVVGFTYAYFTAQVQGNTATKSVEVTAGRLEVLYAQGNKIEAQNIVPGWISDGVHYYDPIYSQGAEITPGSGIYPITAVTTTDHATKSDDSTPGSADGITSPVTITVSNTANNTGDNNYVIRLTNITNGIASTDQANLKVTLKKGASVLWSGALAASGTQIIVPAAELLSNGASNHNDYTLYLTYVNTNSSQNVSLGKSVTATADIIGVVNNGTNWVDADGNIVTFATASTTDYTTAANAGLSS